MIVRTQKFSIVKLLLIPDQLHAPVLLVPLEFNSHSFPTYVKKCSIIHFFGILQININLTNFV